MSEVAQEATEDDSNSSDGGDDDRVWRASLSRRIEAPRPALHGGGMHAASKGGNGSASGHRGRSPLFPNERESAVLCDGQTLTTWAESSTNASSRQAVGSAESRGTEETDQSIPSGQEGIAPGTVPICGRQVRGGFSPDLLAKCLLSEPGAVGIKTCSNVLKRARAQADLVPGRGGSAGRAAVGPDQHELTLPDLPYGFTDLGKRLNTALRSCSPGSSGSSGTSNGLDGDGRSGHYEQCSRRGSSEGSVD